MRAPPRGFALLAVLWVVVALTALAAGAVERARADAAATGDHVARMRARWAAEGCLAVTLSRIETALRAGQGLAIPATDTLYYANGARCLVEGHDPGARFNPDSATADRRTLFDSALASLGVTDQAAIAVLVTSYGDGRININAAPPAVLASLLGLGPEALRIIEAARAWRRPLVGLEDLASRLSPASRASLLAHFGELAASSTFQTGALVLTARGWTAASRASASVEVLVVSGDRRAAIVRRRMS